MMVDAGLTKARHGEKAMPANTMSRSRDYAQVVAELVASLPPDRAAQVYDFARFLQAQPAPPDAPHVEEDDWLNDTEAEMQAEDARWQAAYDQHRAEFRQLRERALREIANPELPRRRLACT
jgi:hypothetical protein